MRQRRLSLAVLLLLLSTFAVSQTKPTPDPYAPPKKPMGKVAVDFTLPGKMPLKFIAYGDIRFTDPATKEPSSPEYRDAIVAEIAKEKPSFVIIVGDLVRKGVETSDWDIWTKETAPLREAKLRVLPVLGNHELWGDPQAVNYFQHFPELKNRRYYTVRAGNCYFLMLDSDPLKPGTEQWSWVEQHLQQLPPDVAYLFVVLHHPPVTQSDNHIKGGGHAAREQDKQLAAMLEDRQKVLKVPIIVLAGHVHSYERYVHDGVTYITTGGGGATPYEIPRQPGDFYKDSGPVYHFCRFNIDRKSLNFEMVKVEVAPGRTSFTVADSFRLGKDQAKAVAASR